MPVHVETQLMDDTASGAYDKVLDLLQHGVVLPSTVQDYARKQQLLSCLCWGIYVFERYHHKSNEASALGKLEPPC